MDTYEIYTDGAYSANLNVGGYAYAIFHKNKMETFSDSVRYTTNNRMEIIPIIKALQHVKKIASKQDNIIFYSDSQYTVNTINLWLKNWVSKRKTHNKKNMDLWWEYFKESSGYNIRAVWVKGHAGDPKNEMVDDMCVLAIVKYLKENKTEFNKSDIYEYSRASERKYLI